MKRDKRFYFGRSPAILEANIDMTVSRFLRFINYGVWVHVQLWSRILIKWTLFNFSECCQHHSVFICYGTDFTIPISDTRGSGDYWSSWILSHGMESVENTTRGIAYLNWGCILWSNQMDLSLIEDFHQNVHSLNLYSIGSCFSRELLLPWKIMCLFRLR